MSIKISVDNIDGDMKVPTSLSQPPSPALLNFFGGSDKLNFAALASGVRQQIRPWSVFLQLQNFKNVTNLQRLTNRLPRNLAHFRSNYAIISLILMLYCLLTSPLIVVVLTACIWCNYKVKQAGTTVTLFKRTLSPAHQCVAVCCAAVPLLYLAGAGAALFWIIGASAFFVCTHAVFYNIDAIVTEEDEVDVAFGSPMTV